MLKYKCSRLNDLLDNAFTLSKFTGRATIVPCFGIWVTSSTEFGYMHYCVGFGDGLSVVLICHLHVYLIT